MKKIIYVLILLVLCSLVNAVPSEIFSISGGSEHEFIRLKDTENNVACQDFVYGYDWVPNGTSILLSYDGAVKNLRTWITNVSSTTSDPVMAEIYTDRPSEIYFTGYNWINFSSVLSYIPANQNVSVCWDAVGSDNSNHPKPTLSTGFVPSYLMQSSDDGVTWSTQSAAWDLSVVVYGENFTAPLPTSSIDLLFSNTTDRSIYKTDFDEGENFLVFINLTDDADNKAINDTNATCNISIFEGLIEDESINDNFTICDLGCDFDTYTDTFNFVDDNSTGNVMSDSVRGSVCHEDNPDTSDISVIISCGSKNITLNQSADIIPLCSEGFTSFVLETDICVNSLQVNISSQPLKNVPFNKRRRVIDAEMDREFFENVNVFGTEIRFNDSLQLFELFDPSHEYYEHGNKTIRGVCTHLSDSNLDNSVNETITIVNIPPLLFNPLVQTSLGLTEITDNVLIDFTNSLWDFTIPFSDDDPDTVNISIYNFTTLVFSSGSNSFSLNATAFFLDFIHNPFSINITINDTFGDETSLDLSFNVTDTLPPVCVGFNNASVRNNTVYTWNSFCTDEYLWDFNIACNNGFNASASNLGTTSYNFTNSSLILQDTICRINMSDGHTKKYIDDFDIVKNIKDNEISFNGITLKSKEVLTDITYNKLFDRYKFCFKTLNKEPLLTVIMPPGCVEAIGSGYLGHFVCDDKYWIDFEGGYPVTVNGQNVNIDTTLADSKDICFNSIGELNILQIDQFLNTSVAFVTYDKRPPQEFVSIPQALFWGFMIFFWLALVIMTFTIKGDNGNTVQIFNIMQAFTGVMVGIGFLKFIFVVGFVIIFGAAGIFIGKSNIKG